MPVIRQRSTDAAAGAVVFPVQGNQYEYLPFDALLEFALLADAGDTWNGSVFSGSDVLMQDSVIDNLATATPIQYPEHFTLQDVAAAGERIGITLTNNTGGVADQRTVVRITPM